MKYNFTDLVTFSGKACPSFEGEKIYVSTGCLHTDLICKNETELVNYSNKPSRANLVAKPGDILFAKMQSTKKNIILSEETANYVYSTGFYAIRANKNLITNKCLYYLISSDIFLTEKDKNCSGATQKAITNEGLKKIQINIPSIEIQKNIEKQLDTVSDSIKRKETQLKKLDDLVKARFVEMFGMPGTDTKGWGLINLENCCELNPKKGDDRRLSSGIKVSFIPMSAVGEHGEIDSREIRNYDEVRSGFTYFSENDVLFAKITPCMENGKGCVTKNLHNNIGFGSTEFHVLRPLSGISNPYWIYVLTSFKEFRKDAELHMTGSAGQRRTPVSFLANYQVTLPPIELQNKFASFIIQVDKSKFAIQKSLEKTQQLFDSLMQEHFG